MNRNLLGGPYTAQYGDEFQPDIQSWTVQIGAGQAEAHIPADTLTIRYGKDEPDPFGQPETATATFDLIDRPDTWPQPGQPIRIAYNGATVFTGWISDTDREYAPSVGSTLRVNAAGPRAQYAQRRFLPGNYTTQQGGQAAWLTDQTKGQDLKAIIARLRQTIPPLRYAATLNFRDDYLLAPIRYWKGHDLDLALELVDQAANACTATVFERRDGTIRVTNRSAYVNADLIPVLQLDASHILAPVQIRQEPVYRNSWAVNIGRDERGPSPDQVKDEYPEPVSYFAPPPGGLTADQEHSQPELHLADVATADRKWAYFQNVFNSRPRFEQIDRWVVKAEFVTPQLWQQLLTVNLGGFVTVDGLPPDLFADGRSDFEGFLFGWTLSGVDTVELTLVDRRLWSTFTYEP